jgi:hypothetical protein
MLQSERLKPEELKEGRTYKYELLMDYAMNYNVIFINQNSISAIYPGHETIEYKVVQILNSCSIFRRVNNSCSHQDVEQVVIIEKA